MNSVVSTFSSLEFCFTGVPDAVTQHLTYSQVVKGEEHNLLTLCFK